MYTYLDFSNKSEDLKIGASDLEPILVQICKKLKKILICIIRMSWDELFCSFENVSLKYIFKI